MSSASKYPEHDKLAELNHLSQACGEFLDWLDRVKHVRLGHWKVVGEGIWKTDEFVPYHYDTQKLLAEHFGIDHQKLMDEKEQMLQEARDHAAGRD